MDVAALTREEYLAIPADERFHLYPGREPSNSTYTGTKNQPGCRCVRCRAEHASAVRKGRQVLQLEPDSVVDEAIGPGPVSGAATPAAADQTPPAEVSGIPPPARPVYSDPGALTADEVAARVLKLAVSVAESNGGLPTWMLAAPEIAGRFGVDVKVAQESTRINRPYIQVDAYLRRPKLVRRPTR
jgi:hypothetical protein